MQQSQVRPADTAFAEIPEIRIEGEMLDLAKHIIETKMGSFDAAAFDDRYEEALAELVKAKIEGRKIRPPAAPKPQKRPADLLAALRASAKGAAKPAAEKARVSKKAAPKASPAPRRKAG